MPISDPLEQRLADALEAAGIQYTAGPPKGTPPGSPLHLDFHLPALDLYIEVKRFHADRIARQMALAPNVIAVQGEAAVDWLCGLLRRNSDAGAS